MVSLDDFEPGQCLCFISTCLYFPENHGLLPAAVMDLNSREIVGRVDKTRDVAQADLFDSIEMFYNPKRRYAYISSVSPEVFEAA